MSEEVVNELLSRIPTGDELHDPRAGLHERAIVKEVNKLEDGSGLVMVFTGLRDEEGNDFDYNHRISFPSRNSEDWMQRMFLATLHDVGLVDIRDKHARFIETPEAVEDIVSAFRGLVGTSFRVRLTEGKTGFLNLRFLREKR